MPHVVTVTLQETLWNIFDVRNKHHFINALHCYHYHRCKSEKGNLPITKPKKLIRMVIVTHVRANYRFSFSCTKCLATSTILALIGSLETVQQIPAGSQIAPNVFLMAVNVSFMLQISALALIGTLILWNKLLSPSQATTNVHFLHKRTIEGCIAT